MDDNLRDFDNCPYADESNSYYYHEKADEIFANVSREILPIVRHPLAVAYNYSEKKEKDMTFKNAYSIMDHLKSYNF